MSEVLPNSRIIYSCYYNVSRDGEQFIPEHVFSYQISGSLTVNDGLRVYEFKPGDFRFSRRNQLAKFVKHPPVGGEFTSISVFLDQKTLVNLSQQYGYTAQKRPLRAPAVIPLSPHPLYQGYMDSLMPYLPLPGTTDDPLFALKVKEAVLLLLRTEPELKDILFDFAEPGKLDLEEFMMQHYQFNVSLNRFAYLSGRSLATFKRDFEKIFHLSPHRWLLNKRLQDAYFLIKEKGRKPSEVYLEVGFEDLSHFSFAFKKAFGQAPSLI
ncbi:AraC family transcriptional regulator [Siphonobacter sp. BAB-5385]|nr:AraC family transcriptional regulator [Siphonobacter sp. BAB-5385]